LRGQAADGAAPGRARREPPRPGGRLPPVAAARGDPAGEGPAGPGRAAVRRPRLLRQARGAGNERAVRPPRRLRPEGAVADARGVGAARAGPADAGRPPAPRRPGDAAAARRAPPAGAALAEPRPVVP